jgi:hypothetical protein
MKTNTTFPQNRAEAHNMTRKTTFIFYLDHKIRMYELIKRHCNKLQDLELIAHPIHAYNILTIHTRNDSENKAALEFMCFADKTKIIISGQEFLLRYEDDYDHED